MEKTRQEHMKARVDEEKKVSDRTLEDGSGGKTKELDV
jgi:hypothetical protein